MSWLPDPTSTAKLETQGFKGHIVYRSGKLKAIVSRDEYKPGANKVWHLSIAHPSRLPSWQEVHDARYTLIPDEAVMAMVLPPKAEYVNIHEFCFHLYELTDQEKENIYEPAGPTS